MKYITLLFLSLVCVVSAHAMESANAAELGEQLIWKAGFGNIKEVQRLIAAGADVNHKDTYTNTALIYAASNGHQECLQNLINSEANLDFQSDCLGTALMTAITSNQQPCLQSLIHAGANLNLRTKEGNTALTLATIHWRPTICEDLVQAMLFRNQAQKITSICAFLHCLKQASCKQCPNLGDLFAATFRAMATEARAHVRQQVLDLKNKEIKKNLLTKFNLE